MRDIFGDATRLSREERNLSCDARNRLIITGGIGCRENYHRVESRQKSALVRRHVDKSEEARGGERIQLLPRKLSCV